jgi:hypothetical protein
MPFRSVAADPFLGLFLRLLSTSGTAWRRTCPPALVLSAGVAAGVVAGLFGASPDWVDGAEVAAGFGVGAWTMFAAVVAHYRLVFGPYGADLAGNPAGPQQGAAHDA